MQRLSQMVLDMQADMASSLRPDLQEDASKMPGTLLNNLRQPAGVRGGETHTVPLQGLALKHDYTNMDEVMSKINTLETKSNALDDLLGRVNRHEGQLRLLMEAAQSPAATPPTVFPASDASLHAYMDERIRALRDELMEGMEIKMSDMKSSCDYKIMSVQEQCEGQETSYLSLAELMDSKEADLRKEILDLKVKVADSVRGNELSAGNPQTPDPLLPRLENLEARLNLSERNVEVQCLSLEKKLRKDGSEGVADLRKALEHRLTSMEDRVITLQVNMSTNLTSGVKAENMDALQSEVNTHKNTIQALEDRLNVLDQLCSKGCMSNLTVIENIKQDLESCRIAMDVFQAGLNGHSDSLGAMEEFVQGHLLNYNSSIEDVQSELGSLRQRVGAMEGSLSDAGHSLSQQSQQLQNLNSTCGQVTARAAQEAKDLLELHTAQRQELRNRLEELSREVRAEADQCREKTEDVEKEVATIDGRVASMESVCGKLEPISGSLQRIKDGLNKHVSGLWTCVSQLNGTLRAHAQDIGGLKGMGQNLQNHVSGIARELKNLTASSPAQMGKPYVATHNPSNIK